MCKNMATLNQSLLLQGLSRQSSVLQRSSKPPLLPRTTLCKLHVAPTSSPLLPFPIRTSITPRLFNSSLLHHKLLFEACLYSHLLHERLSNTQVTDLWPQLVPVSDAFFENKDKVPNFSTVRIMGSWQTNWRNDQAKGPGCERWLAGPSTCTVLNLYTAVSPPVPSRFTLCTLPPPPPPRLWAVLGEITPMGQLSSMGSF